MGDKGDKIAARPPEGCLVETRCLIKGPKSVIVPFTQPRSGPKSRTGSGASQKAKSQERVYLDFSKRFFRIATSKRVRIRYILLVKKILSRLQKLAYWKKKKKKEKKNLYLRKRIKITFHLFSFFRSFPSLFLFISFSPFSYIKQFLSILLSTYKLIFPMSVNIIYFKHLVKRFFWSIVCSYV